MDPHTPYQPPITPGYQVFPPQPGPATAPQPRPTRRWVWPVLAGAAVLAIVMGGGAYYLVSRTGTADGLNPIATKSTKLANASAVCGNIGELADGDKTLVLDMAGEDPGTGTLTLKETMCVLSLLELPVYVRSALEHTRALDGRQTETWGPFEASWTYHPDSGLDLIVREAD